MGDKLAEKMTHADGVVGHFRMAEGTKAGLHLDEHSKQFVVLEAKMFSPLSKVTTHTPFYNQAARNVVCMASILEKAGKSPKSMESVGFYVLAPEEQIGSGLFKKQMDRDNIKATVERRIELAAQLEDNSDFSIMQ